MRTPLRCRCELAKERTYCTTAAVCGHRRGRCTHSCVLKRPPVDYRIHLQRVTEGHSIVCFMQKKWKVSLWLCLRLISSKQQSLSDCENKALVSYTLW